MIYSPVFTGLEPGIKTQVLRRLEQALRPDKVDRISRKLPGAEKTAIRDILDATLPGWQAS